MYDFCILLHPIVEESLAYVIRLQKAYFYEGSKLYHNLFKTCWEGLLSTQIQMAQGIFFFHLQKLFDKMETTSYRIQSYKSYTNSILNNITEDMLFQSSP